MHPANARPIEAIGSYHAHIYFEEKTEAAARRLRDLIDAHHDVEIGRWHTAPVGPHPRGMVQVAFSVAAFAQIVPWLMLNRAGLTILVHPNTGDELADHADHPLWLGAPLPLHLDRLQSPAS